MGLLEGEEEDKAKVSRFSFVSYLSQNNHLIQQSTKVESFKAEEYLGMRWQVIGVAAVSFALFAILSIVALLQLSTGSISKVFEIETFAQKHFLRFHFIFNLFQVLFWDVVAGRRSMTRKLKRNYRSEFRPSIKISLALFFCFGVGFYFHRSCRHGWCSLVILKPRKSRAPPP